MPEVAGIFRADTPIIIADIAINAIRLERVYLLVDTGASRVLLVLPVEIVSPELLANYTSWPLETILGVGSLQVRRAPSGTLYLTDVDGQPVAIQVEPLHVLLYDVDDSGFAPLAIPPSLIGFQNTAFGLSQLLVDNAGQRVVLTYQEPFTPTRLE